MSLNEVGQRTIRQWKESAGHGAREWVAERFTAIALVPLLGWCLWTAFSVAGTGFDGVIATLKSPVNAVLLGLTLLVVIWHMNMGLKVIIEDYISKPATRGFLTFLVFLFSLLLLVVAGGALYLIQGL